MATQPHGEGQTQPPVMARVQTHPPVIPAKAGIQGLWRGIRPITLNSYF